jgi:glucose/arabinose dehydrogenase
MFGKQLWLPLTLCMVVSPAQAADAPRIALDLIAKGLREPTSLVDDGAGRLLITEQTGTIRVVTSKQVQETPLLDIRKKVYAGGECGLLCIALAPDYAASGRVYLNYTAKDPKLRTVVSEVTLSSPDAPSEREILSIPQPFANHNGGQLAFGPDGMLYIGTGDGGSGNDPHKNGQSPGSLLGKILRIDVGPREKYAVPPDNPFLRDRRFAPEIYALGLRNPWRFSFDRKTGEIYAADVGQNRWEEIDLITAGGNYGWRAREGAHPNPNLKVREEPISQDIDPIAEYEQRAYPSKAYGGRPQKDASITGGYVYRGEKYPAMQGWYFYADYNSGRIWALKRGRPGTAVATELVLETATRPSSFGEDASGELYLLDHTGGAIYTIRPH